MQNLKLMMVLSATTIGLMACNPTTEHPKQVSTVQEEAAPPASAILKDTANKMIQSYLSSLSNEDTDLQSLIFEADDLRFYLSDSTIDKVKIMFAHTQSYINEGHAGQPAGYHSGALTLIVAGFDTAGNYVYMSGSSIISHPSKSLQSATGIIFIAFCYE